MFTKHVAFVYSKTLRPLAIVHQN